MMNTGTPLRYGSHKTRERNQNKAALIFLSPWLFGLIVFTAGPMLVSLYYAFTKYSILGSPSWIGVDNFLKMFTSDRVFIKSLTVTFQYALWAVPLKLAMGLAIAMMLKSGVRGLAVYRSVYYLPSLLGGSVAISMLWREIFGIKGLVNQILRLFASTGLPNWVGNPNHALSTLIILFVWQFGAPMVIFLAALKQIPQEYYEAAHIDGAGGLRCFLHITLPGISPIIFFNLIMQMVTAFQSFTPAYIISNGTGGPVNSTMLYSLYLYLKGFSYSQMGYASAMAWVLLLIIGLFTLLIFLSSRFWVSYSDD